MKETKIMVYCDGSYRDGKGAWSFLYAIQDRKEYTIGYGCSHAQTSLQSEIIACIKGLSNLSIPALPDDIHIVVKSDAKIISWFFVNQWYKKILYPEDRGLVKEFINGNVLELYQLWHLVEKLPYKVTFKPAKKSDIYMRLVHEYARDTLNKYDIDLNGYWLRESDADNFEYVNDNHISFFRRTPLPFFTDYLGEDEIVGVCQRPYEGSAEYEFCRLMPLSGVPNNYNSDVIRLRRFIRSSIIGDEKRLLTIEEEKREDAIIRSCYFKL